MISRKTLVHVHEAVRDETDGETAIRVLQTLGERTADLVVEELEAADTELRALEQGRFWAELSRFFQDRGWGEISQERIHPGLGLLRSPDCGESEVDTAASERNCDFTTGLLAGTFTRLAGASIEVVEVSCRSRGDVDCSFALGSAQAVRRLRELLDDGTSLEAALDRLT